MADINDIARRLDAVADRQEGELQTLLKDPSRFRVAQAVMDSLCKNLIELCNYDFATWENGEGQTDMCEVYQSIMAAVEEDFLKMTGRVYMPQVSRQILHYNREKFDRDILQGGKQP